MTAPTPPSATLLPVTRASDLDPRSPERRWLVDGLWGDQAVGIVGGEPKTCLSRARDKQVHAASRVMPRSPPSGLTDASWVWFTRHNQGVVFAPAIAPEEEAACWRSSTPVRSQHLG
jgi:hypothetical protein